MDLFLGFLVWLMRAAGGLSVFRGARQRRLAPRNRVLRSLPEKRLWALEDGRWLIEAAEQGAPLEEMLEALACVEAIALLWAPRRSVGILAAWRSVPATAREVAVRAVQAIDILNGPRTKRLRRAGLAPRCFQLTPGARRGRMLRRGARWRAAWRLASLAAARALVRRALEFSG